ncbi:MAG: LysR family transcriptional regulator [Hydrogenophaga sp.]|uniref:LysR family transcriptional regulator n=1 Tax=Hydrogenophaga sp. TaxID=1904254 RepID=UPI001DFDE213|nr:LysR family transcriptional regulator [Hydrogenophaga sp.]MBX3608752.1 LysR family transcriptional regulator [Hydrogenophaga sp.]
MPTASTPALQRLASRLRFRHLQLLIELDRCGSLRGAAQALNLTQPALSKALGEIESVFGVPLFERSARGVVTTARGSAAVRGAMALLGELGQLHEDVTAVEPMQTLRIGAPPFVAQGYLPPLLAAFTASAGRVLLMEERVPRLLEALEAGELDALLTSYPPHLPDALRSRLRYEKLFDEAVVVIASPRHPMAGLRRIRWHRLAMARWIMPASGSMVRRALEECFVREGVVAPAPLVESTSPLTNIELVAQGIGVGVVPAAALQASHAQRRVVKLDVSPPIPAVPVALMWREGFAESRVAAIRALLPGHLGPRRRRPSGRSTERPH